MAHAIDGYEGPCKNIHGHSYELHVTVVSCGKDDENYLPAPGFVFDFKELKQIVNTSFIQPFDHKLVLSRQYLKKNPSVTEHENLLRMEAEPSAENLLLYARYSIEKKLPAGIRLAKLKLYETKDSYAEWIAE